MKIDRRYWTKKIYIPLGTNDAILWQCFKLSRGKAVDFSVVLRVKIRGAWRFVKRCDASKKHNSVPHCHVYKVNGKQHTENVGIRGANLGVLAKAIIDDIRDNYETILENFKYSK